MTDATAKKQTWNPLTDWPNRLTIPYRWRKVRDVTVSPRADLFAEEVPYETIARIFYVMASTPQHTYTIRTANPDRVTLLRRDLPLWCPNITVIPPA